MFDLIKTSFENFKAANKDYSTTEVDQLEEALTNYMTFTPCEQVRNYHKQNPHLPLQLVRDGLIVDYLHTKLGLTQSRSTELWSDWEDFEFEVRSSNVAT